MGDYVYIRRDENGVPAVANWVDGRTIVRLVDASGKPIMDEAICAYMSRVAGIAPTYYTRNDLVPIGSDGLPGDKPVFATRGEQLYEQYKEHCAAVWKFSRGEVEKWYLTRADQRALGNWCFGEHWKGKAIGWNKQDDAPASGILTTHLINPVTNNLTEIVIELPARCDACGQELPEEK